MSPAVPVLVMVVVCLLLGARCIRDARRGGDFGQVYAWAMGVGLIAFGLGWLVLLAGLYFWGRLV